MFYSVVTRGYKQVAPTTESVTYTQTNVNLRGVTYPTFVREGKGDKLHGEEVRQ